jgi:penicillin-binding protein 1C
MTTRYRSLLLAVSIAVAALVFFVALKKPEINDPLCTVLVSPDGTLLAATIAADEQYRFPPSGEVPEKFKHSILMFEDRHFYRHPGINPFSIIRAARNNIKAGRIVEGGSTITMQTVRLYRNGKSRTFPEKFLEALLALRLEAGSSKTDILSMYASNAPFGGNVVGLDAAAWRYYGRSPAELSWAESAALAVIPNSPALVFPGRNPEEMQKKRDNLLKRLLKNGFIDSLTFNLSLSEPLPGKPKPLPQLTQHLLMRSISEGHGGQTITATIDPVLQERAYEVLKHHHNRLAGNQIHNAAILVLDVEKGNVLAYLGNTPGNLHGNFVDIITAPRSTGSILKPFLYALMLHDGMILPNTLVADIPTKIGEYSPKNFHPAYDGAVPASRAISRSLNIPAVRMLQRYGVERFHFDLQNLGLTHITRSPDNYGLTLILGGAEANLWDLAGVYAAMARTLNNYRQNQSRYDKNNYRPAQYIKRADDLNSKELTEHSMLDASAIYFCFEAMKEVARPDELAGWQYFSSSRSVAWKTGTSFGHRDAWAIGLNPDYVVAVWAGNASGEGRPNLTGVSAAAPILFDIFGLLEQAPRFDKPVDEMVAAQVCRHSGHLAKEYCTLTDSLLIPAKGLETEPCPYHQLIHTNKSGTYRVTDRCIPISEIVTRAMFVLPPVMEWYYKNNNPFYRPLPPFLPGCRSGKEENPMALLYPRIDKTEIKLPKDFNGKVTKAVFEAIHRNGNATIYWHLNEKYLGETHSFHKMALKPPEGDHVLTLVDNEGHILTINFNITGE